MCRGFDPLFSLWQDRARSFWGTFSHPPTAKLSFGVQKLPIFTKIDLFGPKFNFFLDLFGSNFQRPAAHLHQFSGRVPPPRGSKRRNVCNYTETELPVRCRKNAQGLKLSLGRFEAPCTRVDLYHYQYIMHKMC